MKTTRRSALAMLGLAAAGSSAEAVEAFGEVGDLVGKGASGYRFGNAHRDRMANALERLAADIRDGGSLVQKAALVTKSEPDEFVVHTLTVDFVMKVDMDAGS